LAAVSCATLVICAPIFPLLPRYSNLTFLPGVLFSSALAVGLLALRHSTDDFVGRLAGSIDLLGSLDLGAIFGLDPLLATKASDSGISYFVLTQSVIGVAIIWIFICLVPRYRTRSSVILIYSICTYITLNLLVSYSLFSIKTAAPMWFMYGYLTAEMALRRTAPRQSHRLSIGMMPAAYSAVEGRR
jgi:putative polymerase